MAIWHLWCQTSKESDTSILCWLWPRRTTWPRWATRSYIPTTPAIIPNDGELPRKSAHNRKVLTKPRTLLTLHHRRRGYQKENYHGIAASIIVTNMVSTDRIWENNSPIDSATSLQVVWGNLRNRPQRKCSQDGRALWPRITPWPPNQQTLK